MRCFLGSTSVNMMFFIWVLEESNYFKNSKQKTNKLKCNSRSSSKNMILRESWLMHDKRFNWNTFKLQLYCIEIFKILLLCLENAASVSPTFTFTCTHPHKRWPTYSRCRAFSFMCGFSEHDELKDAAICHWLGARTRTHTQAGALSTTLISPLLTPPGGVHKAALCD